MLLTPTYATSKGFILRLLAGVIVVGLLGASQSSAQILHRKKKTNKSTSADNNVQPDKVLYDRAAERHQARAA